MKLKAVHFFILLMSVFWSSMTGTPPQITGEDNKTFGVKGFHLDLRIQVMTPEALNNFADELAGFGFNTLVVEWEASYPYYKHATISNEYAYTRKEVKSFIDYCNLLGIDVIPLQQCFGHVEYILRNKRYNHLKEDRKDISQICPLKTTEDSLLFTDLLTDMVSLHTSDYIHLGGDETYLLGHCVNCSAKAAKDGKSKLFVDYMKMICDIVVKLGKQPVMWADIILKYPEAAEILPKETIFVDWNYGWATNHFGDIENFRKKGFTFWGAPSIRSHPDNWYGTNWEKHFNNQRDFIPYARDAGYKGLLMTSWSTSGLYGFTWDSGYEVIDMEHIRNTYPLSGFRILIAAYAQAINQKEPLDPENFAKKYARERFGLTDEDTKKFWQALIVAPESIVYDKPAANQTIKEIRKKNDAARKIINDLKPLRNLKEFEHFRLMLDLRDFYLVFKDIESIYNSDQFDINKVDQLIPGLENLLIESGKLDQRFSDLNKGFLFDSEIQDQNRIRNLGLKVLYNRLVKLK